MLSAALFIEDLISEGFFFSGVIYFSSIDVEYYPVILLFVLPIDDCDWYTGGFPKWVTIRIFVLVGCLSANDYTSFKRLSSSELS